MEAGSILLTAIVGIVFGLLGGALWGIIKVFTAERKSKDELKKKKIIDSKENPIIK